VRLRLGRPNQSRDAKRSLTRSLGREIPALKKPAGFVLSKYELAHNRSSSSVAP
jgi:hypothetical protein